MKVYSVNYIPTNRAYVFLRHNDVITIRSFTPTDLVGVLADADQIQHALNESGVLFSPPNSSHPLRYPGTMFLGTHDATKMYMQIGEICWKADADFLGTGAVSDRAAWLFTDSFSRNLISPFNRTLSYLPSRANKDSLYYNEQVNSVMTICQPYADSSFDDCTFFLKYSEDAGYYHNFGDTIPRIQGTPSPSDVWPTLRVTGPSQVPADGSITAQIEVLHPETGEVDVRCNSTLYLEDVEGYTPNLRAKVTQGVASFRASAIGLLPGERVRIKVGWRNWPGEVDFIASVT